MQKKIQARPFLKWAGGKSQLIPEVEKLLPNDISSTPYTYIEPFVGSGAVLFWLLNHYSNLKRVVINDINKDLINTYRVIAHNPKELIECLSIFQKEYHAIDEDEERKKSYYYDKRKIFNDRKEGQVYQAALFIFLNRTCFNGLYRVNRNNEFNVPIGRYKKPTICDADNILEVHKALKEVEILSLDFEETLSYAQNKTLFYIDPPYKPLSDTSSFNSYSQNDFNDKEQIRLRDFCEKLDQLNCVWILSNSDVKAGDNGNFFFDDLYAEYCIQRVHAKRTINANAQKRGLLTELLITNQMKHC